MSRFSPAGTADWHCALCPAMWRTGPAATSQAALPSFLPYTRSPACPNQLPACPAGRRRWRRGAVRRSSGGSTRATSTCCSWRCTRRGRAGAWVRLAGSGGMRGRGAGWGIAGRAGEGSGVRPILREGGVVVVAPPTALLYSLAPYPRAHPLQAPACCATCPSWRTGRGCRCTWRLPTSASEAKGCGAWAVRVQLLAGCAHHSAGCRRACKAWVRLLAAFPPLRAARLAPSDTGPRCCCHAPAAARCTSSMALWTSKPSRCAAVVCGRKYVQASYCFWWPA